ncbi:MAG: histidine phosphatase family protein [Pedobacter sp.]|nr:histidine phosphatase family protein [Chitinophagaceae bacterium]
MKYAISFCFCLMLLGVKAQTTTIILLRHAEKDTTQQTAMMKANPPLTAAGELRASKLLTVLKAYRPDIIYSTNFTRTKATVTPLAQKFNKEIQLYDAKDLVKFAAELEAQKGKTMVVAGHSNTTPALVNLLIKQTKYKDLPDSIYNKFWIVTITNGVATEQVVEY